jgi:hypothetical protein
MAKLSIFTAEAEDTDRPITTIAQLKEALRLITHSPTLVCLDLDGHSIQIFYGSPDRTHHEVKHISEIGIERLSYAKAQHATDVFLVLADNALS